MVEKRYRGIPASPGVAIGEVLIFNKQIEPVPVQSIRASQIPNEIIKLENALIQTRKEILQLQDKLVKGIGKGHADIFNAHLLILEDRTLIEEVIKQLEKEKKNVEYIFQKVANKYIEMFSKMEDDYLRERAGDIMDVVGKVLRNMTGKSAPSLADLKDKVIIIAYDLSPSDTAVMNKEKVIGFATDIGSKTSHTAIMARSLEIPAVVGLGNVSEKILPGTTVIVDGTSGVLVVNPKEDTRKRFLRIKYKLKHLEEKLEELKDLPAETKDGRRIILAANIESPEELNSVTEHGSEGVGLYRTEFMYLNRDDLPSEEEHFNAYRLVAERLKPQDVIIRTMDLGGDKFLSHLQIPREMNPFMGWRAIRFSLARLDIFRVQLRAILRASAFGNVKLMYPMISSLEELRRANNVLNEVKEELRKNKIPFNEDIEVGAMIEVPSAAMVADLLAKEVDFFSIGTNDLIQYTFAIDRVNEKVAYLYDPAHPAVLRLLKGIIEEAHKAGIWVGICGEIAGDPVTALISVGLGVDELSTSAMLVPRIKKAIRAVEFSELEGLIKDIMKYKSGRTIYRVVERFLKEKAPLLLAEGG